MTLKAEFDQESYEDMLATLQVTQMSVKDLAERYEVTERTIYRWLTYAKKDGWDIIKRGTNPTFYQVAVPNVESHDSRAGGGDPSGWPSDTGRPSEP